MKTANIIIISLICPLVCGVLIINYTKESVDLSYTLTQGIPTSFFTDGTETNIQQLDIFNLGDKIAEKVSIKLPGEIQHYELIKNSASDSVNEYKLQDNTEIVYQEIPPTGEISVIFSSKYAVRDNEIAISHKDGGRAVIYNANSRKSSILDIMFNTLLFIYVLIVLYLISSFRKEVYSDLAIRGSEKILKRTKCPLFISQKKWSQFRDEAVNHYFTGKSFYGSNLENSAAFKLLNSNKEDYLTDHEWEKLVELAERTLEDDMSKTINASFFNRERLNGLFQMQKPNAYSKIKWDEFRAKLDDTYVTLLLTEGANQFLYPLKHAAKMIGKKNTHNINEQKWESCIGLLKRIYTSLIFQEILNSYSDPITILSKYDLTHIGEDSAGKLQKAAYVLSMANYSVTSVYEAESFLSADRKDWMEDEDYNAKSSQAQLIIDAEERKLRYDTLNRLIVQLISSNYTPDNKPAEVNDDEWEALKDIDLRIATKIKENKAILSEIEEKESRVPFLISKVEKQLQIIHEILNDPTAIDRIESYNDTFSSGNFENLREIAKFVAAQNG